VQKGRDVRYSVNGYHEAVKHNVRLAEKYERLARTVKGEKRKRFAEKAKRYRRRAYDIAQVWSCQTRWNQTNWGYVIEKMFGPLPRQTAFERRVEEDAHKARSYDFWGSSCSSMS